jgi:hypothetical protein
VNVLTEHFQREEFVLFPCHSEKLGLVSFMFAAVHINLEQTLGWVTIPARIREVGVLHLDRIDSPIVGKRQLVSICAVGQQFQAISEVPQVGDEVLVLDPSIFGSKEDDLLW